MIYALLIYDGRGEENPRPADENAAIIARHRALQAEAMGRDQLLAVARLDGVGRAHTVRQGRDDFQVTDGPYLESKEWLVGFYLVECDHLAAAEARAREICPADGSIEIRPVTWHRVPGPGAPPPS